MNDWLRIKHPRWGESCLLCGAPADRNGLCEDCTLDLPWITLGCEVCGLPLTAPGVCGHCRSEPGRHPYRIRGVFAYECPVRPLITAFKFHQGLPEGRVLASLFATAMAKQAQTRPHLLVPVPLHDGRLRERGYNQARILADALGREMGVAVQRSGVERIRNTAPQTDVGMGRQRHANMRGAFRCDVDLEGRLVAIVDDVITSGATVRALGDALMDCGAACVVAYGCARTPM